MTINNRFGRIDNREMAENQDLSQKYPGTEECRADLIFPLVEALHALTQSIQNMGMYPFGHPLVEKSLADSTDAFEVVLTECGFITLVVTRDQLIFQNEIISESSGDLQDLACCFMSSTSCPWK